MKNNKIKLFIVGVLIGISSLVSAQDKIVLNLEQTVALANDSSLSAFYAKNLYLAGYWNYRSYKAERLPSLFLNLTPARYYRDITKRYDYENNIDVFRSQQSFQSSANLSLRQNFDLTGGTFFIDSDLGYLRNFGDNTYTQYTTVPIRIGYTQELIGYNPFKWKKKIEPLKYEKEKRRLLYNLEQTSEIATEYFFNLAMAQAKYDLAKEQILNADTLYKTGLKKYEIASINKADLLTLKLDLINAKNTLQNADIELKRSMFALASFLKMDKNTNIKLILPNFPKDLNINLEEALTLANENNPDYLQLQQDILEAKQQVDRTKKESLFNASLRASVGFNQVSGSFKNAYKNPLEQDVISLSITIPLLDWGVRKGRYNMAKNNLNVTQISAEQKELSLAENLIMTVGEFNIQQDMIKSAEEAWEMASMAYNQTKERFIIGKADINSLTLSNNRQQQAQQNYILALKNYWTSYYKIRKLTLFDFELNVPLTTVFESLIK